MVLKKQTFSLEEISLGFVCSRNLTASCYSADSFAVCILNALGRTTFSSKEKQKLSCAQVQLVRYISS